MPFELERGPVARQLRRLVRKELDSALEGLGHSRPRIHDARTHIKKARSIVKLLRRTLGKRYAREDARLRTAARRLSELRDAEALLQTFEALHRTCPTVITPAIAKKITGALRRDHRKAHVHVRTRAGQALSLLKRSRATLPRRVEQVAGIRVAGRGLTRGYERSRATLADLDADSRAADFHAWRRRVKAHWYHVRLFQSGQPAIRRRARGLKALQSALGDDHNLALLGETLRDRPGRFGGARPAALVLGCIQKRQHVLRRRALASGRRLFASKPERIDAVVSQWRVAANS